MNLTENCELQIHDVKPMDAGVYGCHQLGQSQNSSEAARGQRSENILTVITISNQTVGSYRRWVCSVTPYQNDRTCGYMVKWLVQDSERSRFQFGAMECSAQVTYTEGTSPHLSCEVTDLNRNQVFVLDAAGPQLTESGQEEAHDVVALVALLMLILRSVMACVVMVILIRETRGQWRTSE
uniref:Ig-like domain-containing protein n=1 Tax=Knipowitschia caucasica TaxID=637954 RepID=A0AAV2MBW4_KNICA